MFVSGDFNVYHKDWLTYSGELIDLVNSVIINFPTWVPDCDFHSTVLLDLFISSEASICSTVAFPPLRNSDYVIATVSIDFPINSKQDTPFHHVTYDYSHTDWNGLCDHLRDVPREGIFKLGASAASEFCKWAEVGIDVYITHQKYQVKTSLISMVFSCLCCCHSS